MKRAFRLVGAAVGGSILLALLSFWFWMPLLQGATLTEALGIEALFIFACLIILWSINSLMEFLGETL